MDYFVATARMWARKLSCGGVKANMKDYSSLLACRSKQTARDPMSKRSQLLVYIYHNYTQGHTPGYQLAPAQHNESVLSRYVSWPLQLGAYPTLIVPPIYIISWGQGRRMARLHTTVEVSIPPSQEQWRRLGCTSAESCREMLIRATGSAPASCRHSRKPPSIYMFVSCAAILLPTNSSANIVYAHQDLLETPKLCSRNHQNIVRILFPRPCRNLENTSSST